MAGEPVHFSRAPNPASGLGARRSTSCPHTRAVRPPPLQIRQICSAGASLIKRSRTALYRDTRRSPAPGAVRRQSPPKPDHYSIPGQGHGRHLDRPETLSRVASAHRAAARRNDQALPEQTGARRSRLSLMMSKGRKVGLQASAVRCRSARWSLPKSSGANVRKRHCEVRWFPAANSTVTARGGTRMRSIWSGDSEHRLRCQQ